MNIGMLWYDNSNLTQVDKIKKAAAYYQKKYGKTPNCCWVNHKQFPDQVIEGIEIKSARTVMTNHLWIGLGKNEH